MINHNEITRLTHVLADAYIRHTMNETGCPMVFIESERHQVHVTVLMEQESTAECIRKGLVDLLLCEHGQDVGEQTALFLLNTSIRDGEITPYGITIMQDIFLDGVERQLDVEAGV